MTLFVKVTLCFVLWRLTIPYDETPVLRGDLAVYFAQATKYVETNFYRESCVKAFAHPLICAHFIAFMAPQKELVLLFLSEFGVHVHLSFAARP